MELNGELNYIKNQIEKLDKKEVTTGIISLPIYNRLTYQDEAVKSSGRSMSYMDFEHCISDLKFGMIDTAFNLPSYFEMMKSADKEFINMGILHMKFNRMNEVGQSEFVQLQSAGQIRSLDLQTFIKGAEIVEDTVFACLPLKEKVADGSKVDFYFDEELMFDNTGGNVPTIEFDAGDGKGFRTVQLNKALRVSYSEKGTKQLRINVHYDDQIFESISTLEVIQVNLPEPYRTFDLTAKHFYKNSHATGKVKIYVANKDKGLVKPLYFWTGFNTSPSATTIISTPLELMDADGSELFASSYEHFLKLALDNGYDIVTLEWDDSRNYIQNNGFLAATLIQKINNEYPQSSDGVIVTGSMGGLIARWTALYMEHEEGRGLYGSHKLAKLITLDTPHEGAVMPIAMQYAVDYIATHVKQAQGDGAREGRKVIQSPAACQMLVQQFTPWWNNQNEPKAHEERQKLIATWNEWGGYPKELKNYAVSNGGSMGWGQTNRDGSATLQPGELLLSGAVKVSGSEFLWIDRLKASPLFTSRDEQGLEVLDIVFFCAQRWKATIKKSLPYDSCPGGNWEFIPSIGNQLNSRRKMPFPITCFIPSLSSVGIVNDNLYRQIDPNHPGPFDAIYVPDRNERHASLNPGNTAWILNVLGINP